MILPDGHLPQCHLKPGELLVTQEPQWIVTLLGSCVAVTMFSPRFRLAAMCHAMLSAPRGVAETGQPLAGRFRYVSHVIPEMIEQFARRGLVPDDVEVKMFGGGNVIDLGGEPQEDRSIGGSNIVLARELLESARFRIRSESVGGNHGCKIFFNTHNGRVLHKCLSRRGAIE